MTGTDNKRSTGNDPDWPWLVATGSIMYQKRPDDLDPYQGMRLIDMSDSQILRVWNDAWPESPEQAEVARRIAMYVDRLRTTEQPKRLRWTKGGVDV